MDTQLDEINYQDWFVEKCLFENGTLSIELIQGFVSDDAEEVDLGEAGKIEHVHPIVTTENSKMYRVYFTDVLMFQAYDELAHVNDDAEFRDSGIVGRYSQSSFLNYMKSETLLETKTPGELMHFSVMTAEEWFHVITREKPTINEMVT